MVLNDTSQIQLLPAEPPPVDWSVNECSAAPTASCIESDSFNISTSHTLAAGRVFPLSRFILFFIDTPDRGFYDQSETLNVDESAAVI